MTSNKLLYSNKYVTDKLLFELCFHKIKLSVFVVISYCILSFRVKYCTWHTILGQEQTAVRPEV